MNLAVEAVGAKHSGAATVLLDFLDALVVDERVTRVTVFASPKALRRFDFTQDSKLHIVDQGKAEGSLAGRMAWYEWGLGAACAEHKVDGVICVNGMGLGRGVPQVNLIQQSLPFCREALKTLSLQQQIRVGAIGRVMRRSTRAADCVLVQTPTMASWVSDQFGLGLKRVESYMPTSVLPVASEISPALEGMRGVPEGRRLLYVGNQSPYKNVEVLIDGMALIRGQFPDAKLFLTWPLNHPASKIVGVECLGFLSRDVLAEAYQLASVHLLGSLVETVGLPMMEAMTTGTPVLAADRPYAHDICGDAALYFEPMKPMSFARVACSLLENKGLRELYGARGRKRMNYNLQRHPYKEMTNAAIETIEFRRH